MFIEPACISLPDGINLIMTASTVPILPAVTFLIPAGNFNMTMENSYNSKL
jgi:hypothetical protein